jgi:rod shape-determining protein MreD
MSAPRTPLWVQRGFLPLLGFIAIYLALLPLAPGGGAPMPDFLYCLVFAFVIRAPRAAPVLVVLTLGLFADLMLARPAGLGALGLLGVSELLRGPNGTPRDWSFAREWLFSVGAFALMIAAMTAILALSFAEPPSFAALRGHVIATALAYPPVAALVSWLLGGRRSGNPARAGRLS